MTHFCIRTEGGSDKYASPESKGDLETDLIDQHYPGWASFLSPQLPGQTTKLTVDHGSNYLKYFPLPLELLMKHSRASK